MQKDDRLKRLLYQSFHRGCKETDAILGCFSKTYLASFSDEELDMYEKFISEDDWDIYGWLIGQIPFPEEHDNKVTRMLRDFDFSAKN